MKILTTAETPATETILGRCPIVPVVVLDRPEQARPLAQALLAGGIDVIEVTLRTAAGLDGIRALADLPGMHVGAGSVLTPGHVDLVVDAGARFVVSPGLSPAVIDRAGIRSVPALPGVATASDLMTAVLLGLDEVKLFPASLLGGPAMITALAAPFPGLRFMPSGGVTPETMTDYLSLPMVPAVSGSWMVDRDLLRRGRFDEITRLAAAAIDRARARR